MMKRFFEEDIDRILLPRKARFEGGEAEVHDEYQGCGNQYPEVVYYELGIDQWCVLELLH